MNAILEKARATKEQDSRDLAEAFALSELLAIITIVLLLGLVVFPASAKSARLNRSVLCLYNKKALMVACGLYLDNNHQQFPGMLGGNLAVSGAGAANTGAAPWALGWLDWTTSPDNTNVNFLTNSKYSSLASYLGFSRTVYKCPADGYLSDAQKAKGWTERVRSIAGNGVIGAGNVEAGAFDVFYKHVIKLGDLQFPTPSQCWMYADEHPDSINDPMLNPPSTSGFVDQPGNYHDGSCALVFVDGHTELYRWKSPQIRTWPVRFTSPGYSARQTNNVDIDWLRARTPHKTGP